MRPEEAWDLLEPHLLPLPPVSVDRRQALGRVLADPLPATVDVPGETVSAMDGYALSGGAEPGESRPVEGTIAAGDPPGAHLASGSAARIMTGAPVPSGADRVVPVELTDGGAERVRIDRPVEVGANIRRRGEVMRRGDELLPRGAQLGAGTLALVATHGHRRLSVHRPPRVAVLTTGDEVVDPDTDPAPGQLRDSHTDFLLAAGRGMGLELEALGIAGDSVDSLEPLIRRGLASDVLLLGGGVSMGEFDLVEHVLADLDCEIVFDHVAIQPGKPLVAARHSGGLVFGLPGNPASVMACFWLFVRPALRRLMGIDDRFWGGALRARLDAELPASKKRDRFLPANVRVSGGELVATPRPPVGSHDLAAYGGGSALVRIPVSSAARPAGESCEILPLGEWPPESTLAG
ncbi:MAG: molybdopterin molybdotransferase MoeA [Thermoanaerobaculia bacterium]|nr:molybdopterin molybdotransferase MoeA [Thermoanaerobaculia bacterium]